MDTNKILSFSIFDSLHTGSIIYQFISSVLNEYDILNTCSSSSFDMLVLILVQYNVFFVHSIHLKKHMQNYFILNVHAISLI